MSQTNALFTVTVALLVAVPYWLVATALYSAVSLTTHLQKPNSGETCQDVMQYYSFFVVVSFQIVKDVYINMFYKTLI